MRHEKEPMVDLDSYDQYCKERWKAPPQGAIKTQAGKTLEEIAEKVEKNTCVLPYKVPSPALWPTRG